MMSKWLYILVGDDKTGKTTFQKELLKILCEEDRDAKLDSAKSYEIKHPYAIKKVNGLFLGNRSYQEKKSDKIKTVKDYFEEFFIPSDICIVSSHLNSTDIQEMIKIGRSKFYNVGGVFWTNSIKHSPTKNSEIALFDWDERFTINNTLIPAFNKSNDQIDVEVDKQLKTLALEFALMLINRMCIQ